MNTELHITQSTRVAPPAPLIPAEWSIMRVGFEAGPTPEQLAHHKQIFPGPRLCWALPAAGLDAQQILREAVSNGCQVIEVGPAVTLEVLAVLCDLANFNNLTVIRPVMFAAYDQLNGRMVPVRKFSHYEQVYRLEAITRPLSEA